MLSVAEASLENLGRAGFTVEPDPINHSVSARRVLRGRERFFAKLDVTPRREAAAELRGLAAARQYARCAGELPALVAHGDGFLVTEWRHGETFDQLRAVDAVALRGWAAAGAWLGRLHAQTLGHALGTLAERELEWCGVLANSPADWCAQPQATRQLIRFVFEAGVSLAQVDALRRQHRSRPTVLGHGDFCGRNLLFGATTSLAVIDWQLAFRAPPECDLGLACGDIASALATGTGGYHRRLNLVRRRIGAFARAYRGEATHPLHFPTLVWWAARELFHRAAVCTERGELEGHALALARTGLELLQRPQPVLGEAEALCSSP